MVGGFPLALSPQGDRIAFVTQGAGGYRTVVRRADELEARTELARGSLRDMAFSPDGRWIAYTAGTEVRRIPSDGGPSEVVGTVSVPLVYGMVWTPDDQLILGTDHGLLAMPARGGVARFVSDSATAARAIFPALMPDGRTVLARTAQQDDGKLVAIVLATGKVTELGLTAEGVFGVLDDHLIFQGRNGVLAAAPFDSDRLRITGDPVTIMSGVYGAGLSASGAFAYESGTSMRRPVLAGRGEETVLRDAPAAYADPRFSPDGRRVVVSVETDVGADIWVLDRSAGTFTRMTTEGLNTAPEWTSDGRRILYKSLLNETVRIMWVPVDGSAPASLLFETAVTLNEAVLSPDGRWLVVRSAPGEVPRDIFAVDLTGDRKLVPLVTGPAADIMPRLSPDGRWLAYVSDVSGRSEIYVRPFPGDGARVQVSDAGGSEPLWDRSGRRLFYRTPDGIVAVAVTTGAEFAFAARRLALAIADPPDPTHPSYDVAPDGERFLVLRPAGSEATAMVVYNWQRELREKLRAVSR